MTTDREIIAKCLKGNQTAYKMLYEKYIAYCYGICLRYAVGAEEIKDVVQIIFAQTFEHLDKYDHNKSEFKTWLSRITVNQILNHKRKMKQHYLIDPIEVVESNPGIASYNEAEKNIERAQILHIIGKMPTLIK